jgi:hypothetical protein
MDPIERDNLRTPVTTPIEIIKPIQHKPQGFTPWISAHVEVGPYECGDSGCENVNYLWWIVFGF